MGRRAPIYDHHHAVQFYGDDHSLCTTVAGFLSQGFSDGHLAVAISTPEHARGILAQLKRHCMDVDSARNTGSLILLDAQETLDTFMTGDELDVVRFESSICGFIRNLLDGREDGVLVRAYGEMVDVLWKQGRSRAAIRLEILWNRLAQQHGFALLCGYAIGNFYKDTKGFENVCREHTHVIAPLAEAPARR